LKGFGAKTERMILKGLAIAETAARRLLWADADQLAQAFGGIFRPRRASNDLEARGQLSSR
jgi:DNA polymerase/3'-5' exonuclease PolX